MQAAKRPDMPLLPSLLAWARYRGQRLIASLKPRYAAEEIAALVAGGGNPAGL